MPCRGLEQEKQDLGRQVLTLLLQVQGGEGSEPLLRLTAAGEDGLVTSDDVITDRLLTFTDVQACPTSRKRRCQPVGTAVVTAFSL